jgi:hypothetical protein
MWRRAGAGAHAQRQTERRAVVSIAKSQRAMVVVASLATTSKRYRQLYRFLDGSTLPVVKAICGRSYGLIVTPSDGSMAGLVAAIRRATTSPTIAAVDLVLACHGLPGAIKFQDGKRPVGQLEAAFAGVPNRGKLRLAYNLCCHGATHSDSLHRIGFDAVVGSKGVNANSAFELPALLGAWASGQRLGLAVETGNNPTNREFADAFASLMFRNVDSFKVLSGDNAASLRIASQARP